MIRSKPAIIMRTMSAPYRRRRTKIVEKTNIRPKKGTKFRQSAPHCPRPTKNGQSRRIDQIERARDAKANKPIMGPITIAIPSSNSTITGSVRRSIYLYPKELDHVGEPFVGSRSAGGDKPLLYRGSWASSLGLPMSKFW